MPIDPDQETILDPLEDPSTEGRPITARPKGGGLSTLGLALLTAGTSWAIAACASIWLVPPYLILMAWLLFPSTGRPSGSLEEAEADESDPCKPAQAGEESDESALSRESSAQADLIENGSEPGPASSPAKARRGRGRAKKARPVPVEPTEATWVQVAPGKFVRVEAAGSSDPAGPHGSPGVPVEVGETPPSSDRDESERRESQPDGDVESESSEVQGADQEAATPEDLEEPSEADGIAPEAEGSIETTGADSLEVPPESAGDWPEASPSADVSEDEGEQSSLSETFEPIGSPPWTDVPPEPVQEWEEPLEAADPTETTVDETDFDDAGRFDGIDSHVFDACSAEDADVSQTETPPSGSKPSSPYWPWRLAPRDGNRVGHPSRTFGRPALPRRPVRSSGPPPGLSNPTRNHRQGPRRPSRITRAFPPRSPPFWEWSVVA